MYITKHITVALKKLKDVGPSLSFMNLNLNLLITYIIHNTIGILLK